MKVYVYTWGESIFMFTKKYSDEEASAMHYVFIGESFLAVTTFPQEEKGPRYV